MRKITKVIGGLLFMVLFSGMGIFLWIHGSKLSDRCTIETTATVIEVYSSGTDHGLRRYATISYQIGDTTVTGTINNDGSMDQYHYKRNEQIVILYNPENVEEFVIKGERSGLISMIACILFGLVVGAWSLRGAFR